MRIKICLAVTIAVAAWTLFGCAPQTQTAALPDAHLADFEQEVKKMGVDDAMLNRMPPKKREVYARVYSNVDRTKVSQAEKDRVKQLMLHAFVDKIRKLKTQPSPATGGK